MTVTIAICAAMVLTFLSIEILVGCDMADRLSHWEGGTHNMLTALRIGLVTARGAVYDGPGSGTRILLVWSACPVWAI